MVWGQSLFLYPASYVLFSCCSALTSSAVSPDSGTFVPGDRAADLCARVQRREAVSRVQLTVSVSVCLVRHGVLGDESGSLFFLLPSSPFAVRLLFNQVPCTSVPGREDLRIC